MKTRKTNLDISKFTESHARLNSTSDITLIKPEKLDEFVQYVLKSDLKDDLKSAILIQLSGGLRISELRSLTKENFFEEDGALFFKVQVLKKRQKESRLCRVHPAAKAFILEYIQDKVGKLVKASQSTLYRKYRSFLGGAACTHSFRHSMLSYLLFERGLAREKVAKLVHVSSKIIDVYAHLNERKVLLEEVF